MVRTRKQPVSLFLVEYGPVTFEFSLPSTLTIERMKSQISMLSGIPVADMRVSGLPENCGDSDILSSIPLVEDSKVITLVVNNSQED